MPLLPASGRSVAGPSAPAPSVAGPVAPVQRGSRVGPSEPVAVAADAVDRLDDWLSGVAGVPAAPARAVPTLPAVLALTGATCSGSPAALLGAVLADRPGAAVVHGEQRIEATRAVRVGDRLVFTSEVESMRAMGDATVLAIGTTVATAAGEPVATLRSSFVVTGAGAGTAPA